MSSQPPPARGRASLCQPLAGPIGALAHGCSLGGELGHWVEGRSLWNWVLGKCSAGVTDRPGADDTTSPGREQGAGSGEGGTTWDR